VLVHAAKDGYSAGWLLALNRSKAGAAKVDVEPLPSWGLSDCEFGTIEARLLVTAGTSLATHGHNQKLFNDNKSLLVGIVRALINAIDAKDPYTCGHSDRVGLVAKRLGQELGLDNSECERLYLAGLLHDIGKIGVPDSILCKPGQLSEEEAEMVAEHPQRSGAILQHLSHAIDVLPGVVHHHERYDGKGYPAGLAGEAIPLPARIISVADTYDALTSNRPYRKPLPETKVKAILEEDSGTQWDGRVVNALLTILPEIQSLCSGADSHTVELLAPVLPSSSASENPVADALSATRAG
jgi:HD-GYP domain-containing protein (c-di-GMP phosphodiesterase class II)